MTPPGAEPPQFVTSLAGALRVYSRADDTAICFVTDGAPRAGGERLFDVAFCADLQEAEAVAQACVEILDRAEGVAADVEGWHALPQGARLTTLLPNLLAAARNASWAAPAASPGPAEAIPALAAAEQAERAAWTLERIAWLGFLVGQGLTAKQIAADPIIASTPGAVQRAANRFGLALSALPRGAVACTLPLHAVVAIDRAAGAVRMTRTSFLRRWITRAAREPSRYGLTAVLS